ncbi:isocitrate lyase, partial [Claviceps africana]
MAAHNMANLAVNPDVEDELFAREVEQVKAWWRDARWRFTKRPFTAEQIVSKRGHLRIEYPSNAQAKKLWGILEERFKAEQGRLVHYLDTVYVSGWQSSSTASSSDEPGPDLADYPY